MIPSTVLLLLRIRPKTEEDRTRLGAGLREMLNDDPTLAAEVDESTGAVTLGALGELQLEIVVDRLKRDFQVAAGVDRVRVAYREALTCAAEGEGKVAWDAGGRGEYAHAKIRVSPGEPDSGFVFHNGLIGGTIPDRFVEPIRDGIEQRARRGVLAGYPLMDMRVEVSDGSYHDRDSTETAFRIAGAMAFEEAARKAAPVLLEPVMRVEARVPEAHVDAVVADLSGRRGRIRADAAGGGRYIVRALVPLTELLGYNAAFRSRTGGRGTYELQFDRYVRFDPEMNGDDRTSGVRAPLKPRPELRDSAIALPEPEDDRDEI